MKRRKRHSPEQIDGKLRDTEAMRNAGQDLPAVLQALDEENKRLKELVADIRT